MTALLVGLGLGLLIWALTSKHDAIRFIARIVTCLLTLGALAGMVLFFGVGQRAHWTSDGPGMLLIMIGVFLCGLFAFIFGALTFKVSRSDPKPPLNADHPMTPSSGGDAITPPVHERP